MKRPTMIPALVATLTLATSIAIAQQPPGEGPPPDDRPAPRDRPGRDNRDERRTAQKVSPKRGVVTEFTKNPDGDTDGLRLEDGTEIQFRPDSAEKVTNAVSL
jgi:hypothetical protein